MKKTTFLKIILLTFVFLQNFTSYSQEFKKFTPRYDQDIKGDMLLIGNSILNRNNSKKSNEKPNNPYNGTDVNGNFDMQFINVDNGATAGVFNSSSANLVIPNSNKPNASCYKIRYAALYWGAVTKGSSAITSIKFKMPSGGYNDITGTVIYDAGASKIGTSYPYACFADVTSLVTGATNPTPEGTYTVANVSSQVGDNSGTGLSAGWSLYIVYEDPKLPTKSITSFDGFSAIDSSNNLDIPVTGFRTIPTGPVRTKFAFAALEGDQAYKGDYLSINSNIITVTNGGGTVIRASNNFFNSSVTYVDPVTLQTENYVNRNPASTNTLGYDSGVFEINNNGNAIIKNNDVSAVIGLRSNLDVYFYYFNAIAVDIIAPNIVLTKQVFDKNNTDIGNTSVSLGTELYYNLGFQNIGNDNAQNFTIKDVLPININFDPANIIVPNGSGITFVYTAATRTIVFTVPKGLVEVNDPRYVIKFKVQVVPECNDLSDACSDKIQNQAFASYTGEVSKAIVDDQLSLSIFDQCYIGTAAPTNFLVGLENCVYTKDYQLCGASVVLTAANGYDTYSWSTSSTGTPVIGTTQSITVSQTGTYYVNNYAIAPCRSIKQVVTVSPSGTTVKNPVIPYADTVVQCPNNGKDFPKIFLCGSNATRLINIGVTDATSIIWQKLDETSCPAIATDDCANEATSCVWNQVATGSSYTANTSGQFRVVLNYTGGCFNIYYFNVFKNLLNPTASSRDIICNTLGEIIVGGVPGTGYEFSLSATGPFQDSNIFSIPTPNTYTVYIRQKGVVSNPCLFTVPGIDILKRNFTVSELISQPLCNGDKGSVKLAANDVREQYYYSISKSGTVVNSVGPISDSDYTFANLTSGSYDYEVKTDDGCLTTGTINIIEPVVLSATVNQTKALTCESGEITIYPVGGTSPYAYYVNGGTIAQYNTVINTPTAGKYDVKIIDYNGCITNTSITVAEVPKPVYNTLGTNVNCYGDASGSINFNITNANGYTLTYSIDNGVTYGSLATISNLSPGTYNTILKYSLGGVDCFDTMKPITITQPSTALTASAGVSELAGCGNPTKSDGRIRITNPDGGTPFPAPNYYLYSFDNQVTWVTTNEAFKAPGTYTVYVKDANGCIFPMPNIVIDPEPVAPVIDVATPVDFNCDGTATSTVTINNPGSANFTYNYYLDGVLNTNTTNPNTFLNVPAGTHTVKVEYKLVNVTTYSNLLKETFGYGDDTTSPGINTAFYCFERQVAATQCKGSTAINDGDYSVTANIVNPFGAWVQPGDHTTQTVPPTPKGRSLVVNIGDQIANTDILYQKVINDIIPNQPINFELFAMNLLKTGNTQIDPDLRVALIDASGTEISWFATGNIPKTQKWEVYPKTAITLNPGANTSLKFIIRSNKRATNGNDVAIDDIKVYQLPKSCVTEKNFTVVVPTGKAFTASVTGFKNVKCNGDSNGEITIEAQNFNTTTGYQYSINNGTNWITSTTSPVTITGLAVANYNVMIRYDSTSTGGCVKSIPQAIIAPATLVTTASVTKQATCITGATITASSTGGTTAYTYELWNATNTVIVKPLQNTGVFTNVTAPGSYYVRGYDANACSDNTDIAISVTASTAPTASIVPGTNMCFDPATGANITVNVSGGLSPYSYQTSTNNGTTYGGSSASFTGPTFTHNATTTGTYTFKITDANGCTVTTTNQVINAKLTANASVTTDLDCDPAPNNQAVITGTISGGTAPFTVVQTAGSGTSTAVVSGTTFTYTTAVASAYTFEITDAIGCKATATATISPLVVVTGKATPTDVTCNAANNGSVTLAALTGVAPFTYSFNSSAFTSTTTYTGLAGTSTGTSYPYVIKDAKGCTFPSTVTIKQPDAIAGTASITTAYTCIANATITVSGVSGGNGSNVYTLNRDGVPVASQSTLIFSNISVPGSYTVTITDAKGCFITTAAMPIVALTPPTAMSISNTALKCPSNMVDVTIDSYTGGFGAVEYQITAPASAATAYQALKTFTNLAPGTYTFQIKDAKGCTYSKTHTINTLPAIAASAVVVNNVKCYGTATGSIKYTVSGFATGTNYSYTIDGGTAVTGSSTGNPFDITVPNLPAGAHPIIITNATTNCTATATATVAQPAAALTISAPTITLITCTANATAVINTVGGWGTNSYTVTGTAPVVPAVTQSNKTFTNLTAGNYSVSVTDANGCIVTTTFTIAPLVPVVATIDATASNYCYVAGTGATLAVTPNTSANYVYSINGGATQANGTFANLTPGNYVIRVRDTSTNCFIDLPSQTIANQVTASTTVTKDLDCSATPNATIQVSISNGYAPYEYQVRYNSGTYSTYATTTTPFTYTATAAGIYDFQIKDAKGCTTVVSRTINAIVPPTFTTSQVNVKCKGDNTGSITVSGIPASGTYSYTLTPSTGPVVTQSTNVFGNLKAGAYSIVIKDSKSCDSAAQTITITEPTDGLTATASATTLTCNTSNTQQAATITVAAINGTPFATGSPYLYSYNGGTYGASNTFTINTASTVTINVKDANGCIYTVPSGVTIAPLNPPTALAFTQGNVITCSATTTNVTLNVTGGSGTLAYAITAPASAASNTSGAANGIFTNLLPNTYTFKVTDANGCTITGTYKVDQVVPITVTGSLVANVTCNGLLDGSIKYVVAGNMGTFTYALLKNGVSVPSPTNTGTGNTLIFAGLSNGAYKVIVTNPATSCTAFADVIVTQPTAISSLNATATKVFCSQPVTTITVSATGGTSPLYYAVVKSGDPAPSFPAAYNTTGVFTKNTTADGLSYTAYVVDKNGNCPQNIPVSVVSDPAPSVSASALNQCLGSGTYTITASGAGIAPLTYSLNGGGYVSTNTFTVTAAGTYTVTIKDGNGCTAPSNVVTVYPKVTISAVLDKNITCSLPLDAQITLTAGGGNGSYTYESKEASGTYVPMATNVFNTNTPGSYTFRVTDTSGNTCTATTTTAIQITTPVYPDITGVTQTQFINCNTDNTAAINIAIDNTKGIAPFVYNVKQYSDAAHTILVNDYGTQTSGLAAGYYIVTITDAKGCTDTDTITIAEPKPIVVEHHEVPITCGVGGISKGSIIIDKITDGVSALGGTGGTAPYNYFVTGVNGYSAVELNNAGTTSTTFNVVDFGLYQINVVDANGCTKLVQNVLVASPPDDLDISVISPPADCSTPGSAIVGIGSSSSITGTGPFYFRIYTGPGVVYSALDPTWIPESPAGSKQASFPNLTPGVTYTFMVYDADASNGGTGSGCYYYETATSPIPTNSAITVNPLNAKNITCKGAANGNVTFTINHPYATATPVTYQIYDSQTTAAVGSPVATTVPASGSLVVTNYGNLPFGNYYVLVTETAGATNAGCSFATTPFDITESAFDLSIVGTVIKNANCTELGVITAQAKDGTAPYTYQVTSSATAPLASDTNWVTGNTFNETGTIAGTTYYVYVKDAYGCIKQDNVTLLLDPDPVFALAVPNLCATEGNFQVDVTVTDSSPSLAPYAVSVNGGTFVNFAGLTYSATGLNSGLQTIKIQNKNGCPVTQTITINATPVAVAAIVDNLDCDVAPASPDASIKVDITSGTGPFSYTVTKGGTPIGSATTLGAGITTFTHPVIAADADTYVFQITDANNCVVDSNPVTITPLVTIVGSYTPVMPLCNGGTGTIELSATGGQGPYTYSFNGSSFTTTTTYSIIAGTYSYIIKDALGCEQPGSATLGEPTALAVDTPIIVKLSCGTGNVAQAATVTLNGTTGTGTGAFEYSFNGSAYSATNVFTVNDDGTTQSIPYKVKDANNCEVIGTVTIDKLDPPVFNLAGFSQTTVTCLAITSDVTVSSTNGIGTITYETIAPSPIVRNNGTSNVFTGLTPGDYTFLVTDGNGCTDQVSYRINDVTKIDLQVTAQSDVICDGTTTGTATFAVTGFGTGVGTYSYQVNALPIVSAQNAATISLINLAANTYTIVVTDDATGCTSTKTVTINNPATALTSANDVTPLGCTIKGSVTINAVGGWGNYEYTLTPPTGLPITQSTNVFNNLSDISGAYTTSVKDLNGCTYPGTFTLLAPVNPTATIDVSSDYCYNGSASTTLVVTAASASTFTVTPYEYSIDNGVTFQTSNSFPGLTPGNYNVVVKDAFGCLSTASNTTIEPQVFANAVNTKELDCTAAPDGTIRVTPTGGYSPYTYRVSSDGGTTFAPIPATTATDTDYTVTAAGNYVFEITDSKGCQYVTTPAVVMTAPTAVDLLASDIAITAVDCSGTQGTNSNGTITVTLRAINDNPDYTYTLTPTSPASPAITQSTNVFTGLTAGDYEVVVTSARGCTNVAIPVTIATPIPVVASATAAAFSCSATNTINATTVTVTGTGGAGTYSYSADGTNWFPTNTFDIADTGATQNLDFYVKDANGCVDVTDTKVTIAAFPKLVSAIATQVTQIDCSNTGEEIQVTITGGTTTPSGFTYQAYKDGVADGGLVPVTGTTFNYIATTAGSYYEFEIFDNNTGCSIKSTAYDVPLFNTINVIATTAANAKCNSDVNGAIEINITGYTGTYNYEVYNGATLATSGTGDTAIANPFVIPTGFAAGTNYTVKVIETGYPLCSFTSNAVEITEPVVLALSNVITVVNKNCFNDVAVTVPTTSVTGGTLGYTYAFVTNGTTPVATDFTVSNTATLATTQISPAFDLWDVYVQDANGCQDMQTIQVTTDPMPTITAVVATQCPSATGTYDITATATTFNSVIEYSIDGISFQPTNVFTVSAPGDYTVTVRDANQCTVSAATPVTILEPLQLQAELTTTPNCVSADGVVTLTAKGGTVPASYEYSQDGSTYVATNVFSGLAPNATPYTFYVRDLGTTCIHSVDVLIDVPNTTIDFSLSKTEVTCNGGNDGTILVTLATPTTTVNTNPIYKYSIDGGVNYQDSNLFTGLIAGNYTIDVLSGKGCPATQNIQIVEPGVITVPTPTVVDFGCTSGNATNLATITVAGVTGGSGTYANYEFLKAGTVIYFGSSNTYTEADVNGGSYTVNVYDDNGCIGSTPTAVTIKPFVALDKVSVTIDNTITCSNLEDITVKVSHVGPTVPTNLAYTLIDVDATTGVQGAVYPSQTNATGVFTSLPVGNYLITIDNLDTGCSVQGVHYVNEPNTFDLTVDNVVDVTCFSGTNGSVNVTFVDRLITTAPVNGDDAGAFTYTLVDALGNPITAGTSVDKGPITISNLAAGTYTISASLTNTPFCTVLKNFTITGPTAALVVSETHSEITCVAGNNDGTISVTATGGWPGGYEYELVGPTAAQSVAYSTQTEFTDLTAGTYTINARDSKGCVDAATVVLANPTPITLTATASTTLISCFGDKSATITAGIPTGGSGNYLFSLVTTFPDGTVTTDGPQVSNVFTDLGAGNYQVQASDSWGCIGTSAAILINEPAKVVASLVVASTVTCTNQATLTLNASGGTAPYLYSTDPNFATSASITGSSITFPVPVGTYNYYIKDANGCISYISNDITIDPLPTLVIDVDATNAIINCKGDDSGVIVATAQGGLGNYVYSLLDSSGNPLSFVPTQTTPGYFTNLVAGFYNVKVVSMDCNTQTTVPVEIKEPLAPLTATYITTDVTCSGEGDGKIEISASGGTGVIKYAISPDFRQFFDSSIFDNLDVGIYDVLVQDERGCFNYITGIEIFEPKSINATSVIVQEEICLGENQGSFNVDIIGGTAPYSVSLDDINGTYTLGTPTQTQFNFSGLSGGDHKVYIKDNNNCTSEITVVMGLPVNLDPVAVVEYGCTNNAASNMITVTLDRNFPDISNVEYAIDGSTTFQSSEVFTNVASGSHTITVRYIPNGCEKTTSNFNVDQIDPLVISLKDGGLNEIIATTTGGAGGYQYSVNGEYYGSTNNFIIYKTDDYTISVTDINGCTTSAIKHMDFIEIILPNVFTPNGDGNNDTWFPLNAQNYKDMFIYMFDRYGRKLGTFRQGESWDGTYNGTELPSGDYWYVLKLNNVKDSREFVGNLTLYR